MKLMTKLTNFLKKRRKKENEKGVDETNVGTWQSAAAIRISRICQNFLDMINVSRNHFL
jgi:hypothetical protein